VAVLTTGTTAVVDLWLQLMLRTIQAAAALKRRLAGRQAESAAAVQVRRKRLDAAWQSKRETDQLASSNCDWLFCHCFTPPIHPCQFCHRLIPAVHPCLCLHCLIFPSYAACLITASSLLSIPPIHPCILSSGPSAALLDIHPLTPASTNQTESLIEQS
jgi:hypothetical protein